MRLKRLTEVTDTVELARDVPTSRPGGAPLLRHGAKLDRGTAQRLIGLGVQSIWIEDDLGAGIEPVEPLSSQMTRAAEKVAATSFDAARQSLRSDNQLSVGLMDQVADMAADVAQAVFDCRAATVALDSLGSVDGYAHVHAVHVTTVGLLLGQEVFQMEGWTDWRGQKRSDRKSQRMSILGMGLLVHDIGKISLTPDLISKKKSDLSEEELVLLHTHPEVGASLLPVSTVSPLAITVVRNHHERWDGKGYPAGKVGAETHQFARICAIANTYDAVTSPSPNSPGAPPYAGVKAIRDGAGTKFDPDLVEHFLKVVMPYPVGHEILLPDNKTGVVVANDAAEPEAPTVRYRRADGTLEEAVVRMHDGELVQVLSTRDAELPPEEELLV